MEARIIIKLRFKVQPNPEKSKSWITSLGEHMWSTEFFPEYQWPQDFPVAEIPERLGEMYNAVVILSYYWVIYDVKNKKLIGEKVKN